MPLISVQFGAGGISIEREFEVAPRPGEILNVTYGEDEVYLLVVTGVHAEDPDTHVMRYFVHCTQITDLTAELRLQRVRAGSREAG